MKRSAFLAGAVSAASAVASPSSAVLEARASGTASSLPTITTKGNAFWSGTTRFYIKGVDYQPGGSSESTDPLADPSICKRDIPYFKELGLNTVRVYAVDNSKNHDDCMGALADAGIYLALDVNTPKYSLNRDEPAESYNPTYLQSVFATIDAFAGYSNTLLFFNGNEVLNSSQSSTAAAPYVKAVGRDMKQYIGERGYRSIPVGYSAADVSDNQYLMAQYMDCGDEPSRSDFYAINNYEWCDPSSFAESGWDTLVEQYRNYSKPLFLSEYGCITNDRTFAETDALYQPDMTVAFSGGLVYEYTQEGNGYGLVITDGNRVTPVGQQFSSLKAAMSRVQTPSGDGGYQASDGPQDCPGQSSNWDTRPFTGNALPATPSGVMKYFKRGAGKGPGLGGSGSQDAGGGSSATASANAGAITATYGSGSASGSGRSSSSISAAVSSLWVAQENLPPLLVCGVVVVLSSVAGASVL